MTVSQAQAGANCKTAALRYRRIQAQRGGAPQRLEAAWLAAMVRAAEHEQLCARPLNVRLATFSEGLTVTARIATRSNREREALRGRGVRQIPWGQLERRAPELVALVDQVVGEVQAAIDPGATP